MNTELWDEMTIKLVKGRPNAAQKEPSESYREVLYQGLLKQANDHISEVIAEHPERKALGDTCIVETARILRTCRQGKMPSSESRHALRMARLSLELGYPKG